LQRVSSLFLFFFISPLPLLLLLPIRRDVLRTASFLLYLFCLSRLSLLLHVSNWDILKQVLFVSTGAERERYIAITNKLAAVAQANVEVLG